jgi:cation diffusion facilitator family transporter
LSDAAESIMNIVASVFALYSIQLASKPKDLNHPYGHGKVEFFSLGFEGALILVTGIWILIKSANSFFSHPVIQDALPGAILVGITGLVNYILGIYLIRKSKSLNSLTLFAEGKHLLSDTISGLGIVMGLIIIHFTGFFILDGIISLVLGVWMLMNGYSLIRKSVAGLMDEADTIRVEEIIQVLVENRSDNWVDIHNLRVQTYGESIHIDAHITLPYYFDLKEMGKEIQDLKIVVRDSMKTEVELFIQADPCDPECCHYCRKMDCPVRYEKKNKDIVWNYERLVLNQKHYLEQDTGILPS